MSERVTTLWPDGGFRTTTMLGWLKRRRIGVQENEAGRGQATASGGWPIARTIDLVMQDIDRRFGAKGDVARGRAGSLGRGGDTT